MRHSLHLDETSSKAPHWQNQWHSGYALHSSILILSSLLVLACETVFAQTAEKPLEWLEVNKECRPWAYNWWMGSAVDEKNLTRELERYRDAGLGGIHIVPIYGAKGFEKNYLDYLSPKWMRMFDYAVREADRLGLGVDMTTGTGWCFGGPNVSKDLACMTVQWKQASPLVLRESGTKVKRAAPGGEGFMLNPLYDAAMEQYLKRFIAAFPVNSQQPRPRAMYHDSYEYNTQWSPDLLEQFEKRRGYKLQEHLPELFGKLKDEDTQQVLADYRETVSDMMIENVFPQWTAWCRERGMMTRNQAHGSPGNLLDLYALADIPETEMFGRGNRDPLVSRFEPSFGEQGDRNVLVSKFASSAAHVMGKKLVAAETGTWMAEHFCETLEEMKCLADLLFAAGVNHVFYHGCCYSPDEAAWPGWLFYASSEMNPRSAIWRDVPTLNAYIARCQSVLQSGSPDNDILLYWPIHDLWHEPSGHLLQGLSVHQRGDRWLGDRPIGRVARQLWSRGYTFDYVSDRQLAGAKAGSNGIAVPGGVYRTVLVPTTQHIPLETFQKLLNLAEEGATVIFQNGLPEDVPGFAEHQDRQEKLKMLQKTIRLVDGNTPNVKEAKLGKGRILTGDIEGCLALASVAREEMADREGVLFIRRSFQGGRHYFIANQGSQAIDGWVPLAARASAVVLMDPMTGAAGFGNIKQDANGRASVYLQLAPGASIILRAFEISPRPLGEGQGVRAASAVTMGNSHLPTQDALTLTLSQRERGLIAPSTALTLALSQRERGLNAASWKYLKPASDPIRLDGKWQVKFLQGGPTLPKPYETSKLDSWTKSADPEAERFAGTAVYTLRFNAPKGDGFLLDLGKVCHSTRVRLNSRELGVLIMAPYRIPLDGLKPKDNVLEIEVTNLSANRIRDLDRRKVEWRIFNDVNFVNIRYRKPFDASGWPIFDSGLLGPVTLTPMR